MPWYYGSAPNAVDTIGNIPFNKCKTTFYNFFRPAFAGHRGSVRWKYCRTFTGTPTLLSGKYGGQEMCVLERKSDDSRYERNQWIIEPPEGQPGQSDEYNNRVRDWAIVSPHGGNGLVAGGVVNPNLEVELPWYSQTRFARLADPNFSVNNPQPEGLEFSTYMPRASSSAHASFVAVGEDFNMFFYHGPPIHYRYMPP